MSSIRIGSGSCDPRKGGRRMWSQLIKSDDQIYGGDEMKVKVKGGYKIRNHKTGKLWPKVYTSLAEVEKRLRQMASYK
jgi:hypothetical protein